MKLTEKFVEAFKVEEGQQRREVADSVQHGLRLRVNKEGRKIWSVQKTIKGQRRRFTIGDYPTFSLKDARTHAGRMLVAANDGHDPVKEKREARKKREAPATLEDAISAYEKHLTRQTAYERENVRALKRELSKFMKRPSSEITRFDLVRILDKKKKSAPVMANRLTAALKVFFKWLSRRDPDVDNIAATLAKPSKETPRDRALTLDEIRAVWEACAQLPETEEIRGRGNPVRWDVLIRLLMLTAQRREEVASMRWEHLDFENKLWRIPAENTKNKQPHLVPLSDAAVSLLRELERPTNGKGYVFTTTRKTPVSGFSKIKTRLDELSKVKDWRLHDLRRTAVSNMVDLGVDAYVADRVLNHVAASTLGTVQRVYQRSEMLPQRREALDLWANIVTGAVERE